MKRFFATLILLLIIINFSFAQEGYPSPTNKQNLLFYIQHNRGKNTYIYTINFLDNSKKVDEDEPIEVKRQLFDKNGEVKSLTAIQRNFAYGIDCEQINEHKFEASIVSLPSQKLYLNIAKNGHYFVETSVNGVNLKIDRIFIKQKDGTSGLSTKLDYILFYGVSNGKNTVQKLSF